MNSFASLVVLYAGFVASYGANGLLARVLDLDRYGDVMVAMGVAAILARLLLLGGQGAARRFLPLYLRDQRYALMNGFILFYCTIIAVASLVVAGAVVAGIEFGLLEFRNIAIFVVVMTPLVAASTLLGSSLQSIGRPVAAIFPYQVLRPLLLLVGIAIWIDLVPFETTRNAFTIYVPVFLLLLIIQLGWYLKALPYSWRQHRFSLDWSAWSAVGLPLLYSGLLNSILLRVDLFALETFDVHDGAVGTFSLLVLAASILWVNYNAVSNVVSPRIAPLVGERAGLERLLRRSGLLLLCLNIATAVLMITFARPILATMHPGIEGYWPWLAFLCVGATINATLELASPFVRFGGLHAQAAKWATPILLVNAVATTAAVVIAGLEGALVSLVVMRFLRSLVYVRMVVVDLGLRPWRRSGGRDSPEQAADV